MPHIHVVGTGTIGEPLVNLLQAHRNDLGFEKISFHKRTPLLTDRSKVLDMLNKGVQLAVDADRWDAFTELGMPPSVPAEQALEDADVVVDCTPKGNQRKQDIYANYESTTLGFIAQGSESGFGKPYARGYNDSALVHGEDKYIQVVSCNTHNLAALVEYIGFGPARDPERLASATFLCMRRANDVSQDAGFLPSPEAGTHGDDRFGTHHARDVHRLFQTLGIDLKSVFSSALKLNTQYMHTIFFDLHLEEKTSLAEVVARLQEIDRIAVTYKMTSNSVFSFGRDHGFFGRIFNQTVMCLPSLHVSQDGRHVRGFCFTPQDGNSLLSSAAAATWLVDPDNYEDKIQCLSPYFYDEV